MQHGTESGQLARDWAIETGETIGIRAKSGGICGGGENVISKIRAKYHGIVFFRCAGWVFVGVLKGVERCVNELRRREFSPAALGY